MNQSTKASNAGQDLGAVSGENTGAKCATVAAADCHCQKDKDPVCPTCSTVLKGGLKYENICTTCNPQFLNRCGGCQRLLYDCMCIRPHTWE